MIKMIKAIQEMKLELTGGFAFTTVMLWLLIIAEILIDVFKWIIKFLK